MSGKWMGGTRKRTSRGQPELGQKRGRPRKVPLDLGENELVIDRLRKISRVETMRDSGRRRALFMNACQREVSHSPVSTIWPPRASAPKSLRDSPAAPTRRLVNGTSTFEQQRADLLRLDDWTGIRRRNMPGNVAAKMPATINPKTVEPDFPSPQRQSRHVFTPLRSESKVDQSTRAKKARVPSVPERNVVKTTKTRVSDPMPEALQEFQDYRLALLAAEMENLDRETSLPCSQPDHDKARAVEAPTWHDQIGQVLEIYHQQGCNSHSASNDHVGPDAELFARYLQNLSPDLRQDAVSSRSASSSKATPLLDGEDECRSSDFGEAPRLEPLSASLPTPGRCSESDINSPCATGHVADTGTSNAKQANSCSPKVDLLGKLAFALVMAQQGQDAPCNERPPFILTAPSTPTTHPTRSCRPRLVETDGRASLHFSTQRAFEMTPPPNLRRD